MAFWRKLVLLLSAMILMSCVIQFAIFDKVFIKNIDELFLDTNEQAAETMSGQLVWNFDKMVAVLKGVAEDDAIRENQEMIAQINAFVPEIDVFLVLDGTGNIVLASGNREKIWVSNVSTREYFYKAMQGKTYISDVYKTELGSKFVAVSVPVLKDGKANGVVVGIIRMDNSALGGLFDDKLFGRDGYISVTDRQGNIVYHHDKQRIGQKSTIFNSLEQAKGSLIAKDLKGVEQFVGYYKVEKIGWTITVNTPTQVVKKNRDIIIYERLLLSVGGSIVFMIFAIYTIKRYTKPLEQLVEAFNRTKSGNYMKLDPKKYNQEFQKIVYVYNKLVQRLEKDYKTLAEEANVDQLTGAYNRRAFDRLCIMIAKEVEDGYTQSIGLCLLDLDHFKETNDQNGHLFGDALLKSFTQILKNVAGSDAVFRFGGDEFAVVRRDVSSEELRNIAKEIRMKTEKDLQGCTTSIGAAISSENNIEMEKLFDMADRALYCSKKKRNCITFAEK
jgi:diguanylate cyclase (GGDEF)-like protein